MIHTMQRRAFTLIELLVVIAIISLLVSILLPSLNKAKELAKQAVCLCNMRNLGFASLMYGTDNRFLNPGLPIYDPRGGPGRRYNYPAFINPYLGGSAAEGRFVPYDQGPDIYYCPNHDFEAYKAAALGGANAWHWPSYAPNVVLLPMVLVHDNSTDKPLPISESYEALEVWPRADVEYRTLGDLARPSEQVLYGESDMYYAKRWWLLIYKHWMHPPIGVTEKDSGGRGAKHWNDQSSSVFADGHAAPLLSPLDNAERDRYYGP